LQRFILIYGSPGGRDYGIVWYCISDYF
jgi:hypothetical protein